jgi:predicted transcriptional regulator
MSAQDNGVRHIARKEKRGKIDIMASILNITTDPVGKTRIMYNAVLSYQQLVLYLEELQEKGLIEAVGDNAVVYRTTEKGREFIRYFSKMSELLENC